MSVLLDSFWRVHGFDPARDRLIVIDCSRRPRSELARLEEFARQRGWALGREVRFVRRRNWGKAEGARVDYFEALHKTAEQPKFIWQFQDHFLNPESPVSRWEAGKLDDFGGSIAGEVKDDTIDDGAVIDIDANEALLDAQAGIGILHANRRGGIGFCGETASRRWFFAHGGNFCTRPEVALRAFPASRLAAYRAVFDDRTWQYFMEWEWGRLLSETGYDWWHVGNGSRVNPGQIEAALSLKGALLEERGFAPLYEGYAGRVTRAVARSAASRAFAGWYRRRYWQGRNCIRGLLLWILGPSMLRRVVETARHL